MMKHGCDMFTYETDIPDILEQLLAGRRWSEFGAELAGVGSAHVGNHSMHGVRHCVDSIH